MQHFIDGTFPWWLAAITFSLSYAVFILLNQQLKLHPSILMIWRGLGVSIAFSPFMFLVKAPTDPEFYMVLLVLGLIIAYIDYGAFSAASRFGAGVTSRVIPLNIILSFSFWWVLHPSQFSVFAENTGKLVGVVCCLFVCLFALFAMKKDKVSNEAVKYLMPVVLAGGAIDILNKTAMSYASFDSAVAYYICITSFIAGSINFIVSIKARKKGADIEKLFSPKSLKAGAIMICVFGILQLTKNYGMATTENPAYVSVIGMGSALWILLFNKIRGIKDRTNIFAGFCFVLSAACLIVLTSF